MSYNESLSPNSNYPAMSQSQWDSAPFNQPVIPERDFDLTISQSLSKDVTVSTDNYIPEYDEEDGHTYANTEDTDWAEVYKENGHLTPLQLIERFHAILKVEQKNVERRQVKKFSPIRKMKLGFIKHLIAECEGWTNDETEIVES